MGMERTAPITTRENTMSEGIKTIIYPVQDLAAATALYTVLLGREPYADTPYYVGFKAGGQDIGLDPNGHKQGMTGPVGYHQVGDIKTTLQALLDGGAEVDQDVRDVGNGRLIATVKDPDGNVIGLLQDA
jgi:predicted enzyme related to lactoylglutathione lyase